MIECMFEFCDIRWIAEYEDFQGEVILHGIYLEHDGSNSNLIDLIADVVESDAQSAAEMDAADRRSGRDESMEDR